MARLAPELAAMREWQPRLPLRKYARMEPAGRFEIDRLAAPIGVLDPDHRYLDALARRMFAGAGHRPSGEELYEALVSRKPVGRQLALLRWFFEGTEVWELRRALHRDHLSYSNLLAAMSRADVRVPDLVGWANRLAANTDGGA
ncbi:MAG: hypothetical protein F4089_09500 [Gammaproteobacteria bacterium]|nr:hypothetical protein [Gammaproteobacteria bacterium]MYJ75304.1 hypothetical protein [Gammaproteobacteria bacterium]